MGFFQNTCKPEGLGGKLMVSMMNSGHASLSDWGFSHIEVFEDDLCLDIGCGGGANVKRLLEKAPRGRAAGADYSDVSVEASRRLNRAAIQSGRCEILPGNAASLPFADGSFTLATAFETVYFWPGLSASFKEVYRVLKDGGRFMICNESCGDHPKDAKWESRIKGMKVYSEKQLAAFLKEAGFSEIKGVKNEKGWLCLTAKKASPRQPLP